MRLVLYYPMQVLMVQDYIDADALVCLDDYIANSTYFKQRYAEQIPYWRASSEDGKIFTWQRYVPSDLTNAPEILDIGVRSDMLEQQGWPNLVSEDDWFNFLQKAMQDNPETNGQKTVGMFHGYTGSAGDWQDKVGYAASGLHVAAMDCRGQGGESEDVGGVHGNTLNGHITRGLADGPDKLLFHDIFLDTALLARIVMRLPGVDPNRVGAMGGSQGGGLSLACAALEPRIARVAATYPFLCDYRRVWDMDLAKDAYVDMREYFRHFDPLHECEEQIFLTLGYIDVAQLAARIRGEVLMATGLMR